jgi:hypothetical protein
MRVRFLLRHIALTLENFFGAPGHLAFFYFFLKVLRDLLHGAPSGSLPQYPLDVARNRLDLIVTMKRKQSARPIGDFRIPQADFEIRHFARQLRVAVGGVRRVPHRFDRGRDSIELRLYFPGMRGITEPKGKRSFESQ